MVLNVSAAETPGPFSPCDARSSKELYKLFSTYFSPWNCRMCETYWIEQSHTSKAPLQWECPGVPLFKKCLHQPPDLICNLTVENKMIKAAFAEPFEYHKFGCETPTGYYTFHKTPPGIHRVCDGRGTFAFVWSKSSLRATRAAGSQGLPPSAALFPLRLSCPVFSGQPELRCNVCTSETLPCEIR